MKSSLALLLIRAIYQNFISLATVRDVSSLRQEFLATLVSLNLIPRGSIPSSPALNTNSANTGLVKAIILGGLWSRVARVSLPKGAIKFDRVQAGTVQRVNEAKEYRFYDINKTSDGQSRMFLHPSSILFHSAEWKSPFVAYFQKQMTTKLYLQGISEVIFVNMLSYIEPNNYHFPGPGLRAPVVRRSSQRRPYRGRIDYWRKGCGREAQSLAPNRCLGQSASVRLHLSHGRRL